MASKWPEGHVKERHSMSPNSHPIHSIADEVGAASGRLVRVEAFR